MPKTILGGNENQELAENNYATVEYAKGKAKAKKPGRPKKIKAHGPNVEDIEGGAKKKPGRPKKNNVTLKKAKGEAEYEDIQGGAKKPVQKMRGRPRKGRGAPELEGGGFFEEMAVPFEYIGKSISNIVEPSIKALSGGSIWDSIADGILDTTHFIGNAAAVPISFIMHGEGSQKQRTEEQQLKSQILTMKKQFQKTINIIIQKTRDEAMREGVRDKNAIKNVIIERTNPLKLSLLRGENELLYKLLQQYR